LTQLEEQLSISAARKRTALVAVDFLSLAVPKQGLVECQRLCHEVVSFAVSGLAGLFSLLTLGQDLIKDL